MKHDRKIVLFFGARTKTKNRFSVVKIGNAKWSVFDAQERAHVWECRTRKAARDYARSQNTKEFLRTAPIISSEPMADYLARIAREKANE